MALLVQKFGGTSMQDIERIQHAAEIVAKTKAAGHDVVVVVSAMAGETDRLISLAHALQKDPSAREYAALVSTGEQVTMALMAMALQEKGLDALSYTGAQAGIHTCDRYKKARIQSIESEHILKAIKAGRVVVIAGFQGVDVQGNVTTLGRGGSDTSAVAIAAALDASECQIFTDVEGVFTTDPNMVKDARRLDSISFEDMLELASLGSKVLQIRSVEFAGKYNVPLRVLSSQKEGPGTLISYEQHESMESPLVSGIAFSRQEAKMTLSGMEDVLTSVSRVLAALSNMNVNIDLLSQSSLEGGQIVFTVHQDDYESTLTQLQQQLKALGAKKVEGQQRLAKLSLVGAGLKSHPSVVATLFSTLSAQKIHVELMSMSEIKVSVVIDADKLEAGVRALHRDFHLDKAPQQEGTSPGSYPEETSIVYSEN